MPNPSSFSFPNFAGLEEKSGCLEDAAGIKYALARFQDENVRQISTAISGNYSNNSIIGSKLVFPNVAAGIGWSGSITGATVHINNTTLTSDSLSLMLFGADITVANTNATNISALALTDADADNYLGMIGLSNITQINGRTFFSSNTLNFKYTCVAQAISALLILNSSTNRTLSSARIASTLQINKS